MEFDVQTFDVAKFDAVLARGLSSGVGERDGQMCIEAAICAVLDLPHGDEPGCVAPAVRSFKIALNDGPWSSPKARADGLRDLGLAQLGSLGVVDDRDFARLMADKTIRVLIPRLFREVFPSNAACLAAADTCEAEGTENAAAAAWAAAREAAWEAAAAAAAWAAAARAAAAAAWEAARAAAWEAAAAARAARAAARAANEDAYLIVSAQLALEVLRELKSPGCALLDGKR
jgi:hypothetical protein